MPRHNSVATTCTASMLTDWSNTAWASPNEKERLRARLNCVDGLIRDGFKRDFAMLFAITTQNQVTSCALEEFMPLIGFEKSFRGVKSDDKGTQRHQETGDLTMWCTTPKKYEESLVAYKKVLTDRLNVIDPPKMPDPARQKFPDIRLKLLAEKGILPVNTHPHDILEGLLKATGCTAKKAEIFIEKTYGVNPSKWNRRGDTWVKMSYDQLKRIQRDWKAELV